MKKRKSHTKIIVLSTLGALVLTAGIIAIAALVINKPKEAAQEKTVLDAPTAVEVETPAPEPETTTSIADTDTSGNCTTKLGKLMLINANFRVSDTFITGRRSELINITEKYGVGEVYASNGTPLLDAEAAAHLGDMVAAYGKAYSNHTLRTMSCFRTYGTSCGRLCAATGTSDHHTGYTCDLIDTSYGTELDTDDYADHLEWHWLKENSYKYGFIDRYPVEWAGGSMSLPLNVDETGTTGYYETWHYRYVGIAAALEIATGKYNNGEYDSLEHYLKATGRVNNLVSATCN